MQMAGKNQHVVGRDDGWAGHQDETEVYEIQTRKLSL